MGPIPQVVRRRRKRQARLQLQVCRFLKADCKQCVKMKAVIKRKKK